MDIKNYICHKCGRVNRSIDTLLKDNKPECLYACYPAINSLKGQLINLKDRREIKENKNE